MLNSACDIEVRVWFSNLEKGHFDPSPKSDLYQEPNKGFHCSHTPFAITQ